jgi:hypothetical protein
MVRLWIPCLLAAGMLLAAQPPTQPMPEAALEPSLIAIPIRVNLEPIFQAAERAVPRTPPGVETWTPLPDGPATAHYRFNLYRDPLVFRLQDHRLTVRTTIHYWLEVGLKAGGWVKSVGSCGLKEEHRKAMLGVQTELYLTPTWGLNAKVTPQDPMPVTPCEITFLSYDITDKVAMGMRDALAKATLAMELQVRENALLRQKADAVWNQAQNPVEISPGVYLMLNPERIRIAPLRSEGRTLIITPEILARPFICFGQPPVNERKALPPLEPLPTHTPSGIKVRVDADLSFEQASAQLRRQLAGKVFETEKGVFEVLDASVRGEGDKALLSVDLKGKVNGRLTLAGRPVFAPAAGTLQLEDLDYTLESKSWITQFGEWLFRSSLKKTLAEKANWFMDKSLKDLKEQVQVGLNRELAPGLRMTGSLSDLRPGQPQILSDRFHLNASLEGQIQLQIDSLPGL